METNVEFKTGSINFNFSPFQHTLLNNILLHSSVTGIISYLGELRYSRHVRGIYILGFSCTIVY